jgi:hypothetical protein
MRTYACVRRLRAKRVGGRMRGSRGRGSHEAKERDAPRPPQAGVPLPLRGPLARRHARRPMCAARDGACKSPAEESHFSAE